MSIKISICLPTLNSIKYLKERLESIRRQTFKGWELIVFDSFSDDGTSEALYNFSVGDERIHIYQAPKDGIYKNFNRCIKKSKGEYIYIATSDDIMANNCLEKMAQALSNNPDCDLAHCPMRVFDEDGKLGGDWWSTSSLFSRNSGVFFRKYHKRCAPLDGILCLIGDTIYSSVTQLLIRRSLFDKIGYYQSNWGSLGDFHWNLRAGLIASTVHVPDTWGGWRMHSAQATASIEIGSPDHQVKIENMIDNVLKNIDIYITNNSELEVFQKLECKARKLRSYLREHASNKSILDRRIFVIRNALLGNSLAWQHLMSIGSSRKRWPLAAPEVVSSWLNGNGLILLD